MKLRFIKRSLTTAAFVASAGFLVSSAFGQSADDMGQLLKDGVELMQRGKAAEANAKFREVLAANPSNEDAYNLVKSTDFQVFLEMLKAGGSSEQTAARLLDLSHKAETAMSQDAAAIAALVTEAINGNDLGKRTRAVNQLVASHGEYAVPALVKHLGSNDIDVRANAIIAISRLGTDAVAPLAASLTTGSDMQRRNAAEILGRIGDERAIPALLAASGSGGSAGDSAAAAAAALGGSGDASEAYLMLAKKYYHGDAQTLRNYDGTFTVWAAADGAVAGTDVPGFIYNYELAEQACYDALALNAASSKARAMIALTAYGELAAWNNLSAEAQASDAMASTKSALAGARALAAAAGHDDVMGALSMSMHMRNGDVAALLCGTLADLGWSGDLQGGSALTEALTDSDKTIRYAAAIALLRIDPSNSFPTSNLVAQLAGDAASEAAIQQVLVIDSDTKNGMNTQRALNDAGFYAVAAQSGAEGLLIAKRTGGFDAIMVRDTLSDLTSYQVLDELRGDFRTANAKTVVIGGDAAKYSNHGIAGVSPTSDDAVGLVKSVKDALAGATDANAAAANGLSVSASNAVAGVKGGAFNLSDAQGGLLAALRDGSADEVRLAALGALANIADADAAGTLTGVLSRSENSAEIRAAAGAALGRAIMGVAPSGDALDALVAAMGDESIAVRTAAGGALSCADLTDDQRAKVLMARRLK